MPSLMKPCTFCGAKGRSKLVVVLMSDLKLAVECVTCRAFGPPREAESAARRAWNARKEGP